MMPPFTTAPLDPAIDDEDYPSVIAVQLRHARLRVEDAGVYEGKAREEASSYVEAVKAQERALWQEFEDYLLQALLWREKQTGRARLPCAVGLFLLQDAPASLAVDDLAQVQEWAARLSYDLVQLQARLLALAEGGTVNAARTQENVINEIVTDFYGRRGLLPDGCRLLPTRRVPTLCQHNPDTPSEDISSRDISSGDIYISSGDTTS